MTHLIIRGQKVEPKVGLHFGSYLDRYYFETYKHDEDYRFAGGSPATNNYFKLLEWDRDQLTVFWMAATVHLSGKERPTPLEIANAIEDELERGTKLKTLCRDAAYLIETSSAHRKNIQRFIKELEYLKTLGGSFNERLEYKTMYLHMRRILGRRKRVFFLNE